MCGILAILRDDIIDEDSLKYFKKLIDNRGPDYSSPIFEHRAKCGIKLRLTASVLHLRGCELQKQPVIDEQDNVLLFNGQIYKFNRLPIDTELSDTLFLSRRLKSCQTSDDIANTFAAIDGPFAFIYWHNELEALFYGRDIFGRKSLCRVQDGGAYPVAISTLGPKNLMSEGRSSNCTEVECLGIYCLKFKSTSEVEEVVYPWNLDEIYPPTQKCTVFAEQPHNRPFLNAPIDPLSKDMRLPPEISPKEREVALDAFQCKLLEAISTRVKYNRQTCLDCRLNERSSGHQPDCHHSKYAVAFSGGIDSTLLALMLDRVVHLEETIDLVTIAFKDESPDRASVSTAFRELRRLSPKRNWRLVLCDIEQKELQLERARAICQLISPCNTVVDDSLGCACWFISRARGRAIDSSKEEAKIDEVFQNFLKYNPLSANESSADCDESKSTLYTSPATMLFAGMSIDEQMGGYSSHRAAWFNSGVLGVYEEISFQMRRLSSRNLGRDDRTCSDHGRDVKLPYLDFELVSFLNSLPIGLKMDLDEPLNTGPKKLLRDLARQLGLEETSLRVKRALQFGSRIANLESRGKEKGGDICSRLS